MMKMRNQDRQDWQDFLDGDKTALTNIYQRHKDSLMTYCFYLTGNRQKCEDLLHETFLKLIEQGRKKIHINSVKDWLFICMRNLTFNYLKKDKSKNYVIEEVPVGDENPEMKIFIGEILSKLTPEERELILLREHQGFPINELAEMFKTSPEAVRIRLYRIRRKMYERGKE